MQLLLRVRSEGSCDNRAMEWRSRRVVLIHSCSLLLSLGAANAQQAVKTCPSVEVLTFNASAQLELPEHPVSPSARGEIAPALISTERPTAPGASVKVIAIGPILGAMDSTEVKADIACTPEGIVLTATITRSADYHGSVLANVNWRPRVEIELILRKPEVVVQSTWRMRLTTGKELDHAATPPLTRINYPIIVTKLIRSQQ
jgi:hypothetical protein